MMKRASQNEWQPGLRATDFFIVLRIDRMLNPCAQYRDDKTIQVWHNSFSGILCFGSNENGIAGSACKPNLVVLSEEFKDVKNEAAERKQLRATKLLHNGQAGGIPLQHDLH